MDAQYDEFRSNLKSLAPWTLAKYARVKLITDTDADHYAVKFLTDVRDAVLELPDESLGLIRIHADQKDETYLYEFSHEVASKILDTRLLPHAIWATFHECSAWEHLSDTISDYDGMPDDARDLAAMVLHKIADDLTVTLLKDLSC
jgi:hypothetical protein